MEGIMNTAVRHGESASVRYVEPSEHCEWPLLAVIPRSSSMGMVHIAPEFECPFKRVTDAHVRFACELVESAQEYLNELLVARDHGVLCEHERPILLVDCDECMEAA